MRILILTLLSIVFIGYAGLSVVSAFAGDCVFKHSQGGILADTCIGIGHQFDVKTSERISEKAGFTVWCETIDEDNITSPEVISTGEGYMSYKSLNGAFAQTNVPGFHSKKILTLGAESSSDITGVECRMRPK